MLGSQTDSGQFRAICIGGNRPGLVHRRTVLDPAELNELCELKVPRGESLACGFHVVGPSKECVGFGTENSPRPLYELDLRSEAARLEDEQTLTPSIQRRAQGQERSREQVSGATD